MRESTNNTRSDLRPLSPDGRPPRSLNPSLLPQALYVSELLAHGLTHVRQDSFRGTTEPAQLAELGTPVLVRANPNASEVEAVLRLVGGALALIGSNYQQVSVDVAARTPEAARDGVATLRRALEAEAPEPERVSVAFWTRGEYGGEVRHREITAPAFDDIAGNYGRSVRAALERLVALRAPERGRLVLWRGEPGTGKSHALRALARAWAPWCSAHFVMDPADLLGAGGTYILDLLASDDASDRWRLLILEDAGELIAADARALTGQALSRLLNLADGLLGQGTRTLVLITTNEPVRSLHPAARRPGRCLADIEFTPLSADEANAWLAARGFERRVDRATPLAELFSETAPSEAAGRPLLDASAGVSSFGFARALAERV